MSTTVQGIAPATVKAIGMVGRVVTYGNDQYKIHSVEGRDFYAFLDGETITVDFSMTEASWIKDPVAMIIPAGHKIGDGYATEVPLWSPFLRPGVCLTKSYA